MIPNHQECWKLKRKCWFPLTDSQRWYFFFTLMTFWDPEFKDSILQSTELTSCCQLWPNISRRTKCCVFFVRGTKEKTKSSGQTKKDLMKNKRGKIVSKKAHSAGVRRYKNNGLSKWTSACMKARKSLGIVGFKAVKKGTAYYKEARKIYDSMK